MPDRERNEVAAPKRNDEGLESADESSSVDTLLRNLARTTAYSVPPASLASGRYVVQRVLGEGGQKIVCLVHDAVLNRECALSLLKTERIDPKDLLRLRREAQAIAHLGPHPHIVSIYDLGEEDGRPYVVSEYLPGGDVRQLLRSAGGPLLLDKALALGEDMCRALVFAHSHGIIHRDIKPENIWLSTDGTAKLGDFGLALAVDHPRLTLSGAILGTSAYVAPEQAQAKPVDGRTDLYSLGCVLYELTTGQPPFVEDDPLLVISQHLHAQPIPARQRNSAVTPEVDQLLLRMLAKTPDERPASAAEVLSELKCLRAMQSPGREDPGEVSVRLPPQQPISEAVDIGVTRRRSRSLWIVAVVAGLVVVITFGRSEWQRWFRNGARPHIQSIAVLPLENLSGDPSQQYFADGMTDAVITNLAQISALRVISRTSAMQYKGSDKKLREIARELNVDALVEGSVVRSGGRVRISGLLIHAATDQHLWANSYERDVTDVVALQAEVAQAIAKEIRVQLRPEEQARLASAHPIQPEAYENYLKGQFHRMRENKDDNEIAIALLERAVSIDPSFPDAYAELARAYAIRLFYFAPLERQWEEKAFVAVEKAVALKPDLAEAHLVRGFLLWTSSNHFPHERAAQEYRRALAINPNLDDAHHHLGVIYLHIGLLDKALDEVQKALAINPSNTIARYRLGAIFHHQGRYEEALAVLQTIPMKFTAGNLGRQMPWTLFSLGKKEEAAALVEQTLRDNPQDEGGQLTSMQAMLFAAAGEPAKAKERIEEAAEQGKGFGHFHHAAYNIAVSYALLKETELAVRWLRQAAMDGYPCYPLFENDPSLNNLRGDARFIQFMAELKKQWEYYKVTL